MVGEDHDYEAIRYEVDDGIATITLNRPDALNALDAAMERELVYVWDRVDADDAVRAVVVTGAGRAFCAGYDLSEGGFDVVATARWGFVFSRRGMCMDAAASWFLSRAVGISQALEWSLSGRLFGADEALAAGLVRSLHPADELLAAAHEVAHGMVARSAPVSVALNRQLIWQMAGAAHPMDAHRMESIYILERAASADAAEGARSFLEKRPAEFPLTVSGDLPAEVPWVSEPPFERRRRQ